MAIFFAGAAEEFLDEYGCQATPAGCGRDGNVFQLPLAINAVGDEEGEEHRWRLRGSGGRFFGRSVGQERNPVRDRSEDFISEEVSILKLGPVGRGGAELFQGQDGGNVGGSG